MRVTGFVEWRPGLEVTSLPPAGHHAAEDRPHEIGTAILAWMDRHAL